jgi:hypothetical protein
MLLSSFSPTRCRPSQFTRSCVFSLFFHFLAYILSLDFNAPCPPRPVGPRPCLPLLPHHSPLDGHETQWWLRAKCWRSRATRVHRPGAGASMWVPVPVRVPACSCWRASASAGCRRASILPPLLPPLVQFSLFSCARADALPSPFFPRCMTAPSRSQTRLRGRSVLPPQSPPFPRSPLFASVPRSRWRRRGSPLPCRLWFGVLSFVSRVRFCLGFVLLLFLTRSC